MFCGAPVTKQFLFGTSKAALTRQTAHAAIAAHNLFKRRKIKPQGKDLRTGPRKNLIKKQRIGASEPYSPVCSALVQTD
jgi:hypothetical protein